MSSSTRRRSTVIRGRAALDIRAVPFETDLNRPVVEEVKFDAAAHQEMMEAGYREGFESGQRAGYEAGMAAAREELMAADRQRAAIVEDALGSLQAAYADLRRAQASVMTVTENEITSAAFAVAEAVIDRELRTAADPGSDAIARALALAPTGEAVVRMHPADIETLGDLPSGRELTIVADPSIERAGAVVEVGACTIDAQIGAALARVREVLA